MLRRIFLCSAANVVCDAFREPDESDETPFSLSLSLLNTVNFLGLSHDSGSHGEEDNEEEKKEEEKKEKMCTCVNLC